MEKMFSASNEGTGKEKTVSSESEPIFSSDNLKQDDSSRKTDSSDEAKSTNSIFREMIRENLKLAGHFTDEEAAELGSQIYENLVKAFVVGTEDHSSQDTFTEDQKDAASDKDDDSNPDLTNISALAMNEMDINDIIRFNVPTMAELKTFKKNELARLVLSLVTIVNAKQDLIEDLSEKRQRSADLLGRWREIQFGQKSERRKTLRGGGGDGEKDEKKKDDPDKGKEDDEKKEGTAEKESEGDDQKGKKKDPAEKDPEGGNGTDGKKEKGQPRRKKGCADNKMPNPLVIEINKALSDESLKEKFGDHIYREIGTGTYSTMMILSVPVEIKVTYKKYQDTVTKEVVQAAYAKEDKMMSKSILCPELLARLMFLRFSLGMSVPRILKDFSSIGLNLSKQQVYKWSIQYALALIRPFVKRLLEKILDSHKAQTDETWVKIREDLKKEGRCNSVIWLLRTSEALNIPQVIVLFYTGTRAGDELAEILKDYSGTLMSDQYSAYQKLLKDYADQLALVGCLQHCRSYFVDVIQSMKGKGVYKNLSEEKKKNLPVNKILDQFGKVFKAEEKTAGFETLKEKKAHRDGPVRRELKILFDLIESEYDNLQKKKNSYMSDALNYAVKYKQRFFDAVSDPEMPLTNSACERVFASLGVLRSNFKQLDTVNGAIACSLWFSVIMTARSNEANEEVYLQYLIEKLPGLLRAHGDYHWGNGEPPKYNDLSYLDELMPWGENFKKYADEHNDAKKEFIIQLNSVLSASGKTA